MEANRPGRYGAESRWQRSIVDECVAEAAFAFGEIAHVLAMKRPDQIVMNGNIIAVIKLNGWKQKRCW